MKLCAMIGASVMMLASSVFAEDVSGKFVKISLPGEAKTLSLAEVQVMSGGQNVAVKKKASQSSTAFKGKAERAVDGNSDQEWAGQSVTHTKENEANPWWMVELDASVSIDQIIIVNRAEKSSRIVGAKVEVLNDAQEVVWTGDISENKKNYTLKLQEEITF